MKLHLYAESPARRMKQISGDLLVVIGLLASLSFGIGVHDLIAKLAGPGRELEAAGATLAEHMDDAGEAANTVPLAGDELASPFKGAANASRAIEEAGAHQQSAVSALALGLGWIVGGFPACVILGLWLPRRLQFMRHAGQAARLRDSDVGLDLLALRALARQPLRRLAGLGPEVLDGWRNRDIRAMEALASLELRRWGLRVHQAPDGRGPVQ